MADSRNDDQEIEREARQLVRGFTLPWRKQVALVVVITALYVAVRILVDVLRAKMMMPDVASLYGDQWPWLPFRYVINGAIIALISIQFARWVAFRRWAGKQKAR